MNQSDYSFAAKFRDIIRDMVVDRISKLRPPPVSATVSSLVDDRKAMVVFAGETTPVPVSLGILIPTVGSVVLVTGVPGARYVTDILTGQFTIGNSVASLTGLLGDPGPPGIDGLPGPDGDPGPDGADGDPGPAGGIDIQTFGASGSWSKPANSQMVHIFGVGGGGGGGGGGRAASGATVIGGGGGAGGAFSWGEFQASAVPSTLTITVGTGGAGGLGTASTNNGANGTAGGDTSVTDTGVQLIYASGGGGGTAGNAGVGGNAGINGLGQTNGGSGAAGSTTGLSVPFSATNANNGGGGGGGVTSGNVQGDGGSGGGGYPGSNGVGGYISGTRDGVNGVPQNSPNPSGGGAGGGGTTAATGGAGGSGATPGGGGGGGGGTRNTFTSGAGGNGANGFVVIVTFTD